MPTTGGPKKDSGAKATIGDAINYTKGDPGGLVQAVRWIVGFFAALFKPAMKKP